MPYEYHAKVISVTDGDTIRVNIDLGFDASLNNQSIRLLGVDTPESRTSDKEEKMFGLLSKKFVEDFAKECDNEIILRTHIDKTEKFGRILGEVFNPTTMISLNSLILLNYLGVPYYGQSKEEIQDSHLINRQKLIELGKVNY